MSYIAEFVVVLQIRRFLRSLIKTVGGRNFTKHVTIHGFAVLVTIFSVIGRSGGYVRELKLRRRTTPRTTHY